MKYLKTVETNTEPSFIITNDLGNGWGGTGGDILIGHYWYQGNEGETAPKLTTETDGVVYLNKEELPALIAALQEFL